MVKRLSNPNVIVQTTAPTAPKVGDVWIDADEEFSGGGEGGFIAQPNAPDDTTVLWYDTDDNTGVVGSSNADTVDGLHASVTPEAGKLVALDSTASIPPSAQRSINKKLNTTATTLTSPRTEVGIGYITNGTTSGVITFTTPFNTVPIIITSAAGGSGSTATYSYPSSSGFNDRPIGNFNQSTTGFQAQLGGGGPSSSQHIVFSWIAIGD